MHTEAAMFNFAVCDDDTTFARLLSDKISKLCVQYSDEIECKTYAFSSAQTFLEYLKEIPFNVLFLDIDMPGINGFALAEMLLQSSPSILIVFVSSLDEMVYSSLQFRPFRFLRKSRIKKELKVTLDKIIEHFEKEARTKVFHTVDKDVCLFLNNILYIEGQRNYQEIHCLNDVYRCRSTMREMECELKKYYFYRAHESIIINIENIRYIHPNNEVELVNGEFVHISRYKAAGLKKEFMEYSRRKVI